MGRVGPPMELRETDPEAFELSQKDMDLERRSHELAMRIRGLRGEDRDNAREELQKVAGEQFEVRTKLRERRLKRLESEIKELREALENRAAKKDDIIERRMQELLGQPRDDDF